VTSRLSHARTALLGSLLAGLALGLADRTEAGPGGPDDADAIVVGAGLAGLSAAVEMGRGGVRVLVVDLNSVAGGHTVLAGGVTLVGTPVQEQAGIADSAELAYQDWMAWTDDGDPEWTRYYAENSRQMIYDWVTEMGVVFVRVAPAPGNSVPRFHFTEGRAIHLVLPVYRTALGLPDVAFVWNTRADELLLQDGRVSGVVTTNLRSGEKRTLRAPNVVLATGGFESDLARVRQNWMPGLPYPDRLLIGSAPTANGAGLDMATGAGAALSRMDRQYIYINGLVDPRDPSQAHALTAGNDYSMWVNAQGRRFTNEAAFDKDILVDLLQQQPASYWAIFDQSSRDAFAARGAAWLKNPGQGHPILDDARSAKQAQSIDELAEAAGLPPEALRQSVARFNALVAAGEDRDFGRFGPADDFHHTIEQPPYYAVQMFPMTRKSMGGVAVDHQSRALDRHGQVLPGLYAVGEINGSVGINGSHGLDGMFLGPAIITGRLAGRSIAAEYRHPPQAATAGEAASQKEVAATMQAPVAAVNLAGLLAAPREGYWHFEKSHQLVQERQYACSLCHSAALPFAPPRERGSQLAQTQVCSNCH
jgi:predicted oxidoreductase